MALLRVMLPLTGMVEVLTGLQYVRFVEACTTKLLPAGPESRKVKLVLPITRGANRGGSVTLKVTTLLVTLPYGLDTTTSYAPAFPGPTLFNASVGPGKTTLRMRWLA